VPAFFEFIIKKLGEQHFAAPLGSVPKTDQFFLVKEAQNFFPDLSFRRFHKVPSKFECIPVQGNRFSPPVFPGESLTNCMHCRLE
jgi:hypothetical protein